VHRCHQRGSGSDGCSQRDADFAGDEQGWLYLFPGFMRVSTQCSRWSNLARMLQGCRRTHFKLDLVHSLLISPFLRKRWVPWESKGAIVRDRIPGRGYCVELVDGIKIYDSDSWVLILLPDSYE